MVKRTGKGVSSNGGRMTALRGGLSCRHGSRQDADALHAFKSRGFGGEIG